MGPFKGPDKAVEGYAGPLRTHTVGTYNKKSSIRNRDSHRNIKDFSDFFSKNSDSKT